MQNLELKVSAQLPVIGSNFVELKQRLVEELKQYDLIVDADSVKTAKAMATEINKLSQQIDRIRIDETKRLSEPIKEFEDKAKQLSDMCQTSRIKLLMQIKSFDAIQITKARNLLNDELIATYEKYGVKEEFQIVKVEDLAIISNLNKSGLAKKANDAIDERVLEAKRFQEKIDNRLLTLETICFKAGLTVPLRRENINHFLKDSDDDVYLNKLVGLIHNEISRLEEADRLKREQEARTTIVETKADIPKENPLDVSTPQTTKTQATNSQYAHFKNLDEFKPRSKKSNKRTYTVTATFEVEVDESLAPKLVDLLKSKFVKADFKQIPTVTVEEVRYVA